jgi:hypothetical protein
MATWTLNLCGTGVFDLLRLRRPEKAGGPRTELAMSTVDEKAAAGRAVSERRAEAMRGFFPKLSAWMARRSDLAEMREVDRYLSQATNIFELEQRIREIERRGGSRRWF